LIPAIKSDKSLTPNPDLYNELKKRQADLSIKPPFNIQSESDFESRISGREFILENNESKIQSVYFAFGDERCSFALKRDNTLSIIKAGLGTWKMANTASASLLSSSRNIASKSIDANYQIPQPTYKVGASYSWTDSNTLEITVRFVEERLGSQEIVCRFSDDNGSVRVTIEPKAAPSPRFMLRGAPSSVRLRGTLVDIK
jgi:hypothetical protein